MIVSYSLRLKGVYLRRSQGMRFARFLREGGSLRRSHGATHAAEGGLPTTALGEGHSA
jgi:hypothetical protein